MYGKGSLIGHLLLDVPEDLLMVFDHLGYSRVGPCPELLEAFVVVGVPFEALELQNGNGGEGEVGLAFRLVHVQHDCEVRGAPPQLHVVPPGLRPCAARRGHAAVGKSARALRYLGWAHDGPDAS